MCFYWTRWDIAHSKLNKLEKVVFKDSSNSKKQNFHWLQNGIRYSFLDLVNFDLLHIFAWPQQMLEGQDAMDSNASDPLQSGQRTNGISATELDGNNALNHMQLKNYEWQKFNEFQTNTRMTLDNLTQT